MKNIAAKIKALKPITSDDTKPAVCGVHVAFDPVTNDVVALVATDGHMLVAFGNVSQPCSMMLGPRLISKINKKSTVLLSPLDPRRTFVDGDMLSNDDKEFAPIEFARVMPTDATPRIQIKLEYLQSICAAMRAGGFDSATLDFNDPIDPLEPLRITGVNSDPGETCVAVLIPIRME